MTTFLRFFEALASLETLLDRYGSHESWLSLLLVFRSFILITYPFPLTVVFFGALQLPAFTWTLLANCIQSCSQVLKLALPIALCAKAVASCFIVCV